MNKLILHVFSSEQDYTFHKFCTIRSSLHTCKVKSAFKAGASLGQAFPGLYSVKLLVHYRDKFTDTHLYTWMEGGTIKE